MMQWNGADLITHKMAKELFNWKLLGIYDHIPADTDLWVNLRDGIGSISPIVNISTIDWNEIKIYLPAWQVLEALELTGKTYTGMIVGDPTDRMNSYNEFIITKDMINTPIFIGNYENHLQGSEGTRVAGVLYVTSDSIYWLIGVPTFQSYRAKLTLSKIYWR